MDFVSRELPDNILTNELLSKFEDASSIKDSQLQEETFSGLIRQLPVYNRTLLSWLMVLMEHVIEKVDKSRKQHLYWSFDVKTILIFAVFRRDLIR